MQLAPDWLEKFPVWGNTRSALPRTTSAFPLPLGSDRSRPEEVGVSLGHRRQLLNFQSLLVLPVFFVHLSARGVRQLERSNESNSGGEEPTAPLFVPAMSADYHHSAVNPHLPVQRLLPSRSNTTSRLVSFHFAQPFSAPASP